MFKLQLLLLSFLIPREFGFSIGELALSPYRLLLIIFFPYVIWALTQKTTFKWLLADGFAIALSIWPAIAYAINTDISTSIESGGILFIELFTPYFLARLSVYSYKQLRQLTYTLFIVTITLCLLGFFDLLSNQYLVREVAAKLTGTPFNILPDYRFNLIRVMGPTDHPIIFGTICALSLSISISLSRRKKRYIFAVTASLIGVLMSSSSAPLLTSFIQIALLLWAYILRHHTFKWLMLVALVIISYIAIDLLSNRDPFRVMFSYLLFSPHNGYMRYYMWINSIFLANQTVFSALFGYGLKTSMFLLLESPFMASLMTRSVDSFWLVLLLRYGWTMLLLYAMFIASVISRALKIIRRASKRREKQLYEAWLIAIFAFTLIACTVHFWGSMTSLYMIFMGAIIGIRKPRPNKLKRKSAV